jgi:3-deoxy-D-manno-octulosonic-acid transferase
MTIESGYRPIFKLYDLAWRVCVPALRLHRRIKDGFDLRRSVDHLESADLWIQAASAGEAYLAHELLKRLNPSRPMKILLTTNTAQGLEILHKAITRIQTERTEISATASYFPFDRPSIMDAAVARINPKIMILLETEIWPGLLFSLKKNNSRIFLVNGRLTVKSLRRFMKWKNFLQPIGPDKILAISRDDAERFAALFGNDKVGVMRNIKFDRLDDAVRKTGNPLSAILPPSTAFLVMGSVRQEEESRVDRIIRDVHSRLPEAVIGIFPRHMHRIRQWEKTLAPSGLNWRLRSSLTGAAVESGTVILWDAFGELNHAYAMADAVFVGGSLAPLGGQNFLEPLVYGVKPVIGPYWDNFAWVGEEIFSSGLVIRVENHRAAALELIRQIQHPTPKDTVRESAVRYIRDRKGGAEQACRLIRNELHMESEG